MLLAATFPKTIKLFFAIAVPYFLAATARADDVVINQRYPVSANNLSPPNVEATNECATAVYVDSFVPHATVTVYRNGTTIIGGPVAPEFGFAAISLTQPLHTGDNVTATQTVNGITSKPSAPMVAGAMPTALPAPIITTPIYACGRIVPVNRLISGVKVEVRDATAGATVGNGATPNGWGNDWVPVGSSSLTAGHQIDARQLACTGVTSPFSGARAVSRDPSPVSVPSLDLPVVGNDAITANNLLVGANLRAFNGAIAIGSGFATAATNYMKVSPKIAVGEKVTARQVLCAASTRSQPATAVSQLKPPTLVGPICPGQAAATVAGTTINATLVLIKNTSMIIGYGGAGVRGAKPRAGRIMRAGPGSG